MTTKPVETAHDKTAPDKTAQDIPGHDNTSQDITALPSPFQSLRYLLRLAFRYQPKLLWISLGITFVNALPDALFAVWLGMLAKAFSERGEPDRKLLVIAGAGLAFSSVGGWLLRTGADRLQTRFRQRLAVSLETHVARLQATSVGIEQHERPAVLDRLAMLRDQVFTLDHVFFSLFGGLAIALRLAIVVIVLASIQPALTLLGFAAIPPMLAAARRGKAESSVWESIASQRRLARHLFVLGVDPASAKELRVTRATGSIAKARAEAWAVFANTMQRARAKSAVIQTAAWAVFGLAFVFAMRTAVNGTGSGRAGNALVVVAAGARMSAYISAAAAQIDSWGFFIGGAQRLLWLERLVAERRKGADKQPPDHLQSGLALRNVSFAYPGSSRYVLEGVNLELAAGSVVAVVGENGAGKSTLIKLLAGLYEPTVGRVEVDGVDLTTLNPEAWRERMAGAFQDFVKFEFMAQHTVGLGDLPRLDDEPAASRAVVRAGATDVIERLPGGLASQLGPSWDAGTDLSGGQWQKLALARGLVRERPLLVILDEPTSALDAETEHALFERFAEQAREARADGRVTVLVSHRFSTVRMADTIVVLSGSHVVEHGTHDALMALGGTYAEMYTIQAAAYR